MAKAKFDVLEILKAVGTIGTAVGVVIGAVLGAYATYQFVAKDVPAIRADFGSFRKEMRQHGESVQGAIAVLQTEMISLKQRVERRKLKPAEMREILKNVQQVSEAEAQQLSAPQITGDPPQVPPAVTATAREFDFGATYALAGGSHSSANNVIARALFAKNSKWEAVPPQGIKVTYDGGTAIFMATRDTSFEQLKTRAELFNMLSGTLHEFVPVWTPAPPQSPSIRDYKNPNEAGRLLDVVPQRPNVPSGSDYRAPAAPGDSESQTTPAIIKQGR